MTSGSRTCSWCRKPNGDACFGTAFLHGRWRAADVRPEILTERLEWRPDAAARPFVLDIVDFFRSVRGQDQGGLCARARALTCPTGNLPAFHAIRGP